MTPYFTEAHIWTVMSFDPRILVQPAKTILHLFFYSSKFSFHEDIVTGVKMFNPGCCHGNLIAKWMKSILNVGKSRNLSKLKFTPLVTGTIVIQIIISVKNSSEGSCPNFNLV